MGFFKGRIRNRKERKVIARMIISNKRMLHPVNEFYA
jgi:hypothetical protein